MADLLIVAERDELTSVVQRFWDTESIGIIESDQVTEQVFLRDVKFIEESQRCQVSLPWKEGGPQIASGYSSCVI